MPKPRRGLELGIDVGANAAAKWSVESANVDDPHGFKKPR
jgi:hypothetical protein